MPKHLLSIFVFLTLSLLLFIACGTEDTATDETNKHIRLDIVENGNTTVKEADTTQTTLLGLLEELNMVEGSMGEYGYLVSAINGVEADMDNNYWWMIYKDGAWTDSLDKQKIADGETYVFKLEKV